MIRPRLATLASAAVLMALLAVPAVASAHVTVQPAAVPAGGLARLDVRVPTERDDAATTEVQVKFPPGFASVAWQPVPGWGVHVAKVKLATPVQTDDGPVTEGIGVITWTARSRRDGIPPGAFQDFGLSAQVPGKPGARLTFKTLQTYSDGQVVRWIGPEGTDNPAPTVRLTSAGGAGNGAPAPGATAAGSGSDAGRGDTALSVVALVLGALGLAAGTAGLLIARRARSASLR